MARPGLNLYIETQTYNHDPQISQLCSDVQGHWRVCHEQLEDHSEAAGELRLNRLLIKCIIRYEEYFDELALIVSCRVHQSDVDLDNVVVDAPEEEVEEDMKT